MHKKNEEFIQKNLSKPYHEIWHELNGRSIYRVITESKISYQSISKTKTFIPSSMDKTFVFAQLSKNFENACIKARRRGLAAERLIVFIRTQNFRDSGTEIKLDRPSAYPAVLFRPLREGFKPLYKPDSLYRQTGVVLAGLLPDNASGYTLLDDLAKIEKISRLYSVVTAFQKNMESILCSMERACLQSYSPNMVAIVGGHHQERSIKGRKF